MKKLFFILVFILNTIFAYSQTKHLEFMGVPITGTSSSLAMKMQTKGFTKSGNLQSSTIMIGEFAERKASLLIKSSQNTQTVYSVSVSFLLNSTLETMKDEYLNFKRLLIKKYGNPSESVEKFNIPNRGMIFDDFIKNGGNCTTYSCFNTPTGKIKIDLYGYKDLSLRITYVDKNNEKKAEKEADSKILEDL